MFTTTLSPARLNSTFAPVYYISGLDVSYIESNGSVAVFDDMIETDEFGTPMHTTPFATVLRDLSISVQAQVEAICEAANRRYLPTTQEYERYGHGYDPRKMLLAA